MKNLLNFFILFVGVLSVPAGIVKSQPPGEFPDRPRNSQMWVDPTGENDSQLDCIASDNFALSKETTLTRLEWWGTAAPSLGFTISFYNQDTNTTGFQPDLPPIHGHDPLARQVTTQFAQTPLLGDYFHFSYEFSPPITLPANSTTIPRYFVSVHANTPGTWDTWGWAESTQGDAKMFYYQYHGSPAGGPYYSILPDRAFILHDGTPNPPTMSVGRPTAETMSISWPTNATGFSLLEIDSLSSTQWKTSSSPVTVSGTNNTVTLPVSAAAAFYRLAHP
jgi:hypothetical protein